LTRKKRLAQTALNPNIKAKEIATAAAQSELSITATTLRIANRHAEKLELPEEAFADETLCERRE